MSVCNFPSILASKLMINRQISSWKDKYLIISLTNKQFISHSKEVRILLLLTKKNCFGIQDSLNKKSISHLWDNYSYPNTKSIVENIDASSSHWVVAHWKARLFGVSWRGVSPLVDGFWRRWRKRHCFWFITLEFMTFVEGRVNAKDILASCGRSFLAMHSYNMKNVSASPMRKDDVMTSSWSTVRCVVQFFIIINCRHITL